MEVLLDTNFIISCLRKKIDFLAQLDELGFQPRVPKEVVEELKDLKRKGRITHEERIAIGVVFDLFQQRKVRHISLGKKKVDDSLIEKGKSGIYIATLDKGIQRQVPNRIVIASAQRRLMVERD